MIRSIHVMEIEHVISQLKVYLYFYVKSCRLVVPAKHNVENYSGQGGGKCTVHEF